MRIDAHQHYWKIERGDYGWITPDIPLLYRDFLPSHLRPHLKNHRLDGTIVVQAAPTLAETEYILSLASENDSILGVVGYLDVNDQQCLKHYEKFKQHSKFMGFRVMIQEMSDANIILKPHFVETLHYFSKEDVPIDLLLLSSQLNSLVRLMEQVPDIRGVINHIAKPEIAKGKLNPWESQMKELAKYPKIYCKLSGMVTEADHASWTLEQFNVYIIKVIQMFGSKRIMFGSDWPVCLLAADYDQMMNILIQALPESWTEEEHRRLFGLNAKIFYKL